MHLKSRDTAVAGLLIAIGVVLIVLGGYINTVTLFFLAASAFLAGVMERNFSLGLGVFYLVGTTLLGLLLTPQKLHIATFGAMAVYVLVAEWFEKRIYIEKKPVKPVVLWSSKFVVYHVLLAAAVALYSVLFGLKDIFSRGIFDLIPDRYAPLSVLIIAVAAEAMWLILDGAYLYFQRHYGHLFADRNR